MASETLQNMEEGEACAIVMLDLDSFKSINDTYGHDAGDKYLQSFSAVLKAMPKEHFLTARRSGDEFCMMVFGCKSREDVVQYLEMFYETLRNARAALAPGTLKSIRASSGFAWTGNPKESLEELLGHADEALYEVKRKEKGGFGEYQ